MAGTVTPILNVKTPPLKLPTVPNTYTATTPTTGTATTKNVFDWSKFVDNVFGTAGKVLDWQTAKEQAKVQQFDPSQFQPVATTSGGIGIDSNILLIIALAVAAYFFLK